MTTKDYSQLTAASDLQATDLLASWRSTGPLKSLTGTLARSFFTATSLLLDGSQPMTAGLPSYVGSESLPGLTFNGDTDTGFYRISANNVGLSLGGVKRWDFGTAGSALTGTLSVSGAVTASAALTVGTTLNVGTALAVGTALTVGTTLAVTTNATVGGNLTVTGSITGSGNFVSTPHTKFLDYTLVLSDAGSTIICATGLSTLTIPANASVAFPLGTEIYIFCQLASGSISIPVTSDILDWFTGAAVTGGTRTLAAGGWARIWKSAATQWFITGAGLT